MNTSVIRFRVADFLKRYTPFDALPEQDLIDLAGTGRVKFHEADEYVLRQGQDSLPSVWIIQQGRVQLIDERNQHEQLRDVLGEGDLLGLERFFGGGTYLYSARTSTDVILYSFAAGPFDDLIARHPAVKRYLTAHFAVSGTGTGRNSWLDADAPPIAFLQARVPILYYTAPPLSEAAALLSAPSQGVAAIVDSENHPLGLITMTDVCKAVAGYVEVTPQPCPPTIVAPTDTRTAVREMMRTQTEAIAITRDGSPNSPLTGILTASDLALFCGRNPPRIRREIRDSTSVAELGPLLHRGARLVLDGLAHSSDVDDCSRIATEIVAAAAEACLRFANLDARSAGLEPPRVRFCWLAFGRLARGELLRLRPPKIAVIYEDPHPDEMPETSAYFATVAGQMASWFHDCGLEGSGAVWPEGSHPCMPVSEWKQFYRDTIGNPFGCDLFARRELFDVRPLSGDHALFQDLQNHIASSLRQTDILLPLLANDTLSHLPPLTFFQGLVVQLDGTERNALDLNGIALNPIQDAARVFALGSRGMSSITTLDRLEAAAIDFSQHEAVFRDAAEAFRIALFHQTISGTSLIEPSTLSQYDQRLFKTAFASILRLLELTASTFAAQA